MWVFGFLTASAASEARELVDQSSLVLMGSVQNIAYVTNPESGVLFTEATVQVEDVVKGSAHPGENVVFRVLGGATEHGLLATVSHSTVFAPRVGERLLLSGVLEGVSSSGANVRLSDSVYSLMLETDSGVVIGRRKPFYLQDGEFVGVVPPVPSAPLEGWTLQFPEVVPMTVPESLRLAVPPVDRQEPTLDEIRVILAGLVSGSASDVGGGQ